MPFQSVKISAALRPFLLGLALVVAGCGGPASEDDPRASAARTAARHENSLGVVAMDQHNYVRGRAHFESALAIDSAYATAHANLGIALYSLGKYDSARVAFEHALAIEPEHLHASYTLGLIDHAQGHDYERALQLFRRVADHDPDDPLVRYYLGRTHARLGHSDSSLAAFRRAIELDPANVSAYYAMAQEQRQSGDLQGWRATLETFNRLSQAGVEGVSSSYQGQGKYAEAVADGAFGRGDDGRSAPLRFAAAQALPGLPATPAFFSLVDADGDGGVDVVTGDGGGPAVLLLGGGNTLSATDTWTFPGATGAAPTAAVRLADLDLDGDADAVLAGAHSVVALQTEGRFTVNRAGGDLGACTDVVFGDADHDGDADAVCTGAALRLAVNDGTGRFTDVTADGGLSGAAGQALFSDLDADRDVDIVVAAGPSTALYSNNRDGTFSDVADARGLTGSATAIAAGDWIADGWMDLITVTADGARLWAGHGRRFESRDLALPAAVAGVLPADLDNDGDLDLVAYGDAGIHVAVAGTDGFVDVQALSARPAAAVAVADLDADGRLDLLSGEGWRRNDSDAGQRVEVALQGLNTNPDGFGARVEVVTASTRQVREARHGAGPALHFGIGDADVEFVRVLWPSGVRQTEVDSTGARRWDITEVNRKGTSCPILYAWDGERFRFVSDFLGGAIIGYLTAPGQYFTPDTDELLPIRHLAPDDDGRFVLQIGNQLEEIIYLDAAELVAVDHPAGTQWVADERLLSAPPYPSLDGVVVTASQPLAGARDGDGRDVTAALAEIDDVWVDTFELEAIHGYARPHELVLDLGDLPPGWQHPVLMAHGWVDYAHSSSNYAAAQRGLQLSPPRLEARHGGGPWRLVSRDMGRPAGLPKGMLVDLDGVFPAGARDAQLRIATNAAIYWDQFRLGRADARATVQRHRRPFTHADLHWRGYPAHESIHATFAFRYDYDDLRTEAPWGTHGGAFTRYGEVGELVGEIDDRFAILFHGDELTLEIEADAFPPVPAGFTRSWLFYSSGFGKDMDLHSAHSLTVEPLPFHGMSGYPYGPDEAYPTTPEHVRYVLEYNTRWVKGYYR